MEFCKIVASLISDVIVIELEMFNGIIIKNMLKIILQNPYPLNVRLCTEIFSFLYLLARSVSSFCFPMDPVVFLTVGEGCFPSCCVASGRGPLGMILCSTSDRSSFLLISSSFRYVSTSERLLNLCLPSS